MIMVITWIKWISVTVIVVGLVLIVRLLPLENGIRWLTDQVHPRGRLGIWGPILFAFGYILAAVLFVPGSLLEDFRIRATEPTLIDEPRQRSDGRYAFTFPPALAQTLNWYRLEMEVRRHRPRPVQVSLLFDRPLFETRLTGVRVIYADREADPFSVVPEPILGWLPGRATSALPLLVGYTAVLGVIVTAGCAAAFRVVRRG